MTHRLLPLIHSPKPFSHSSLTPNPNPNPNPNPLDRFFSASPPPISLALSLSLSRFRFRSRSLSPRLISQPPPSLASRANQILILLCFAAVLLALRLASAVLLPDFSSRWRRLFASAADAEASAEDFPAHLWTAVVAYEDRRFFSHFGVDPLGIARAVLSLSARGGGSTITQQLVKNAFLKNERTFPRKLVEMVLSIALERKMSKQRILSCYVSKIYWGHGMYGIESASKFYFGKHPSLLTLGECALLAGIIPAPEIRSPFRNPGRGRTYQARVLKRMVDFGFLDIGTALSVLKQPLSYVDGSVSVDGLSQASSFFKEEVRESRRRIQANGSNSRLDGDRVWDWETESKEWETYEQFERWASERNNVMAKQLLSHKIINYK